MALTVLSLLLFSTALQGSAQGQCDYQFISQPSHSDLSCNPWPHINDNNGTLVLECVIIGPQNMDTAHAMWFIGNNTSHQSVLIHFDNLKYSDPIVNEDIGDGMRRVNFMLRVTNMSSPDVGCYWCKVEVEASECTATLLQSSVFCLHEEDHYSNLTDCLDLPTDTSIACAGNATCPSQPDGTTTLTTTSLHTTITGVSPSIAVTQTTVVLTHATKHLAVSTNIVVNVPESTPTGADDAGVMVVGFYAGIAVCIILLATIILLVAILVLLVRKKARRPKNTNTHSSGTSWCNPSIEHSTASSDIGLLADGTTSGATQLRRSHHRLPLLHPVLPPAMIATKSGAASGRESSVSFHYYHVLERPTYYNVPIFQEDYNTEDWEGVPSMLVHIHREAARPPRELRHVYRELEQSTMEPKTEYSRLVLKSKTK